MGRNILYNTQLSMYDKQTNLLTPEADGNVNMFRNTINEWHKHFPNDKFFILLPNTKEVINYDFGFNNGSNITYLFYYNYTISARVNRYNFSMNEISSIIMKENIKIDLIVNDVIEITGNFKQMFNINFGYTPKIISNVRHTDESSNSSYIYRVVDGIRHSDIVTILSESMINRLVKQMYNAGIKGEFISEMFTMHNLTVFEPSVSLDGLYIHVSKKIIPSEKIIITFPGRLSIGEEKRTNWDKFQKAIIMLREKRKDFEVCFTDPNNAMTNDLKENLADWVHTIPRDREAFLNLLNKTDIIVSLMDIEGFGGISIREALMFNCLPIIPYVDEYKKMAAKDYPGFVKSPIKPFDLYNKLDWAIDKIKSDRLKQIHAYKSYGPQFTIEEQFKKLIPFIGGE